VTVGGAVTSAGAVDGAVLGGQAGEVRPGAVAHGGGGQFEP
jgi:hypothetical protein